MVKAVLTSERQKTKGKADMRILATVFTIAAINILGIGADARASFAQSFPDNLVKPGTLTIGTTGASPPSTMYDDSLELVGLDIDLATKIAGDLGLTPEFVVLDWAGMLAGVQANAFDIVASSVSRTPARVESADFFITQAYVANGTSGITRKGDERISDWDDLCNKKIGMVKGAAQIKSVIARLGEACVGTPTEYPGWTEMLLDLQSTRIDAAVGNYITPAYLIRAVDRPLAILPTALDISGNAIVIQPGNKPLAEAVDALLTKYREDGSLEAIVTKWVGEGLDLDSISQ